MGLSFLFITIPIMLISLHAMLKEKRESIKVEAICTEVKSGAGRGVPSFHGTYHYSIDGKEYIIYDGQGTMLKPAINKLTYVYLNKDNYEKIVPQSQIDFYCLAIAFGVIASFSVIIDWFF